MIFGLQFWPLDVGNLGFLIFFLGHNAKCMKSRMIVAVIVLTFESVLDIKLQFSFLLS